MAAIKHYLIIRAKPEDVYKAVTSSEGLKSWWTNDAISENKVGGKAEFRFGERYHNIMQISKLEENRLVEWICEKGDDEWVGTTFSFYMEPSDEGTVLRFTHDKWREETDFFASCNYHWGYYLRSLKLYCETGEGMPFKG